MMKNKTSLTNLIAALKTDYGTPGKILAWGVAIGQWVAILFIVWVFVGNFYFSPFRSLFSQAETTQAPIKPIKVIKPVAKFLEATANSLNERQEVFESLMETIRYAQGRNLAKRELEDHLERLSTNLSLCNTARGRYLKLFADNINPFEMPEIAKTFKELIGHDSIFNRHVIDPHEENKRWKDLCDFCQSEVNKANAELVKILNSH